MTHELYRKMSPKVATIVKSNNLISFISKQDSGNKLIFLRQSEDKAFIIPRVDQPIELILYTTFVHTNNV